MGAPDSGRPPAESRMVQRILTTPLVMYKPPRFSVVNPSISPIIPPSRFHSLLVMTMTINKCRGPMLYTEGQPNYPIPPAR